MIIVVEGFSGEVGYTVVNVLDNKLFLLLRDQSVRVFDKREI